MMGRSVLRMLGVAPFAALATFVACTASTPPPPDLSQDDASVAAPAARPQVVRPPNYFAGPVDTSRSAEQRKPDVQISQAGVSPPLRDVVDWTNIGEIEDHEVHILPVRILPPPDQTDPVVDIHVPPPL